MLVTRECGSNQVWSCFQCVHSWPFCVRVSSEGDLWQSNQSLCSVSLAPELVKAWVCQHLMETHRITFSTLELSDSPPILEVGSSPGSSTI